MGYDNFGLKIGIEGEKEFKNAIREINQSFKVLGSEMNLVASQLINKISQLKPLLRETGCLAKRSTRRKKKLPPWRKRLPMPPPLSGRPTSGRSPGRYSLTTPKPS